MFPWGKQKSGIRFDCLSCKQPMKSKKQDAKSVQLLKQVHSFNCCVHGGKWTKMNFLEAEASHRAYPTSSQRSLHCQGWRLSHCLPKTIPSLGQTSDCCIFYSLHMCVCICDNPILILQLKIVNLGCMCWGGAYNLYLINYRSPDYEKTQTQQNHTSFKIS